MARLLLVLLLLSMAAAGASFRRCSHQQRSSGFVVTALRPCLLNRRHSLLQPPPSSRTVAAAAAAAAPAPRLAQPPPPPPPSSPLLQQLPVPLLLRRRGGFHLEPQVVKASLTAVAELLISCGIGAFATRKGVLDRTVISSLSTVVYNLLLPALLFSNVARTVYSRPLASLLPLPMFATMQIIICAGIARLVNAALRLDPKSIKGREIGVCATFGNSGVVPILFATVLLRHHPDPNVLPLAISYISFYLLGWSPIFWTIGYSWLAGPKRGAAPASPAPGAMSVKERLRRFRENPALARIFSPPILGCVSGLLLGVSPLARFFLARDAPLGVLNNSVETLGKAYSSAALLVLAGSLALPTPPAAPALSTDADGATTKEPTISAPLQILAICLVRFCLCPLACLTIVMKAMSSGLVTLDRLMLFVLFLQSSMPSAQNTIIITQLEGRPADATRLARLLLWIYVLSCVPLSVNLTLFLQKFGL